MHAAAAAISTPPSSCRRGIGRNSNGCAGTRCGNRLELIALIEDPVVIRRILSHLGLPTDVPVARPARSPPLPVGLSGASHPRYDDDIAAP
jgi:hypothetical protein